MADLLPLYHGSDSPHQYPAPDEERNAESFLSLFCPILMVVLSIASLIALIINGEFDLLMYSVFMFLLVLHLVVYHISQDGYVKESESVRLRKKLISWGVFYTLMFISCSCRYTLPGYISQALAVCWLVYMLRK